MGYSAFPADDAVPTIGELLAGDCGNWFWLTCNGCHRSVAAPLAPFAIRWGMHASSNLLRRNFRCVVCGARSTSTTAPSWKDINFGWQQFPPDRAMRYVPGSH